MMSIFNNEIDDIFIKLAGLINQKEVAGLVKILVLILHSWLE